MDDSGYRRLEEGVPARRTVAGRPARHWLPGVALLVALLVSGAVWAGLVFAVIRFWR